MSISPRIPRGIRLNNPGNLRSYVGLDRPTVREDGFAVFNTMLEGTYSLVRLTHQYYFTLNMRSLRQFIGRYAPATENDLLQYEALMLTRVRWLGSKPWDADLRLDRAWNALDFMRAIVFVEQGAAPPDTRSAPEYIPLSAWWHCMEDLPIWKDQL